MFSETSILKNVGTHAKYFVPSNSKYRYFLSHISIEVQCFVLSKKHTHVVSTDKVVSSYGHPWSDPGLVYERESFNGGPNLSYFFPSTSVSRMFGGGFKVQPL